LRKTEQAKESVMRKALIPVDGSPSSERAVKHVIALAEVNPALQVVLLNVQEPIDDWHVRRFLKPEEIEAMEESKGGDQLKGARALLAAAGVRHTPSVVVGPVAETIARTALEQGCDGIVMGTRGLGGVESLVLGSVATKVIHLAEVPVTLVK
jgi:nucleotide-binding universal stress UspA family protein